VKVVVLPLDKAALPDKAEEINTKLAMVMLPGAEAPTLATISMETAQLQAECADATETCYLKIARLVEADRLLWAQVENNGAKAANKKKKGKPSLKLQITLFDRDKLAVAGKADETFAGPITDEDIDKLIATATGVAPGAHPTTPPPAAAPPAAPPPQARPATAPAPAYTAQPARPAPAPAPAPAARPVYQQQPAAQPAYQPHPAAQPTYQPQPAAQPTYNRQPAAAPAPAAYPPSTAPAPGYQPAPAAYPPAAAPPAAAPPAARYQ
jgi:hypothetical protein